MAVCHAEELSIEEEQQEVYQLEAKVSVDPIDREQSYQDIKAPTYNEMKVDYEDGTGWVVEAVLDI